MKISKSILNGEKNKDMDQEMAGTISTHQSAAEIYYQFRA
ncbi:hypothetical protein HRED_03137 [Candidatus Haloredivivus sp. G17]|nr:hypothetical protein HRED_03137 [Candidatus Haloredivivus sp. G17]